MSLEDWLNNRWLHRHETSAEEIQALLHSAEEDIRSAEIKGIAAGWRLNMAYTAALRYARAALYACGYRPGREREHERTIDSLSYTVTSIDAGTIKLLHKIRKMRHTATYDSVDIISDAEADASMKVAGDLRKKVTDWLRVNHPNLLK
ncbi:MAG: HEPN domain-containing protein [Deltaproteobacteria bacterium]|nr:HEPN domain-containing protein [Deltaproteobacteria bacterium]